MNEQQMKEIRDAISVIKDTFDNDYELMFDFMSEFQVQAYIDWIGRENTLHGAKAVEAKTVFETKEGKVYEVIIREIEND